MTTIIQRARQRAAQAEQKQTPEPQFPEHVERLVTSSEPQAVETVRPADKRPAASQTPVIAGIRQALWPSRGRTVWHYGVAIGLALLLIQGVGLAYLAVVMKRSTDTMLSQQVIMADRLVNTQTSLLNLTEGQKSVTNRVNDLTDAYSSLHTQVAEHDDTLHTFTTQHASLRQSVTAEQQMFAKRLDAVEHDVQSVKTLSKEVEDLLVAAEKTWSRVALDLIAYRKGLEQLAQRVNQQTGSAGSASQQQAMMSHPQGQLRQSAMYLTTEEPVESSQGRFDYAAAWTSASGSTSSSSIE